ncbi:general stress protein CsbD [Pseudochryseolinea flava]|uniref:General stress protein CsbD n=1 Tax=Pseudochryseolinea flava TaxID=2059302 RepID=A0A364Y781_9BACT|nr:general stress protein CsbD [Pseudochryseolinea flava]RAW01994.1 general stress protein CsbD [Pseudochryseolinea flava]
MTQNPSPVEIWEIQKIKLKSMFKNVHDDDFKFDYGKKEVMMSNLQVKLGKTREELNKLLEGLGRF